MASVKHCTLNLCIYVHSMEVKMFTGLQLSCLLLLPGLPVLKLILIDTGLSRRIQYVFFQVGIKPQDLVLCSLFTDQLTNGSWNILY